MENLHESGKIYFFTTNLSDSPSEAFGSLLEVNSSFDILKSLNICGGKALGITSNNELLEWEFDSKQKGSSTKVQTPLSKSQMNLPRIKSSRKKEKEFYFLLFKPSYHFHKIKFLQITLNKSMCLGLDVYHNVLAWGKNKDGLLGLGYEITSVETPTLIQKLKDIKEVSLSDYHAVALNNSGNAFSWGLGKYGELGLERSIYTPTPQQILTESIYSKVFCGNLITCFIDENGKFFYYGVIIKQLGGYGNIITLKNLLSDQSFQDGKNIYYEKEIEELENEYFKNIVIGNGFVALLSKNGLLYVLEYNNKLTMLYNKYFLYNITVAYNEIYGLARERPKIDKNKKDHYYLFKWNCKYNSENDLYSEKWSTTVWKFKEDFLLISNCKLLDTNNNKSILLLKDQDEKYNLTNSIYNPHRKNLEMSAQNYDLPLIENSVNNPNLSSFGDLVINKKVLPEAFLDYNNQFDDSFNIKYKKCKLKINLRTGIDSSSLYLNNNKNKTFNQHIKYSQNNLILNNKNSRTMSPFVEQNYSHNNNFFSESYNAQLDLGKENDNVNIYKPGEDDDMIDVKEKELNKYRNEVDNIINNFKTKKSNQINNINTSKKNQFLYKSNNKNESSLKYRSQNNSNQNERYSSSGNNYYGLNQDEQNNAQRNKFKLSKEEMINLIKLENKKNEYMNNKSINNDSLSRVRNNIISVKDKIKFKDNVLNKINNLFTLSEEEDDELDENNNNNSNENNDEKSENKNNNKNNKRNKTKNKKKFMRSSSFSKLKVRYKTKNDNDEDNKNSSEDFVNIEELHKYKRKRYNSKDNILLKDKNKEFGENEKYNNGNNLGLKYISGYNSDNDNLNMNKSKKKNINSNNENKNDKDKNKLKGRKKRKQNNNDNDNENDEEEENEDEDDFKNKYNTKQKVKNTLNESKEENIELINNKKVIKNRTKNKSNNNDNDNLDMNLINQENMNNNKNKNENRTIKRSKNKNNKIKNKPKNIRGNKEEDYENLEEEEEEEEEDEDGTEFFYEINEGGKKIKKIKKLKSNKRIKIKKSNSLCNLENKPEEYKILENSFKKLNNLNNKIYSKSLDKIDKRKDISEILKSSNRIYRNKKKKKLKKNINKEKNKENSNYEEEGENYENSEDKISGNNRNQKNKNRKIVSYKNKNKIENEESDNNKYEKDEYDENNEITFKKKNNNNKNKIINSKKQFKKEKIYGNNNRNEDENSKNSYIDESENDNNNNNKRNNQINNLRNKINQKEGGKIRMNKNKEKYENEKELNIQNINNKNNKTNKIFLKINTHGIAINKFSLMYFCELIEHYMKKKSFSLCARQIANYQKYLEIKFSLKILFRVILKRIIFYKLKFMHRYKRINKYLIKNKIKNISYAYKKKK